MKKNNIEKIWLIVLIILTGMGLQFIPLLNISFLLFCIALIIKIKMDDGNDI